MNDNLKEVKEFIKENGIEKEAVNLLEKDKNIKVANQANQVKAKRGIIGMPHTGTFPHQTTMSLTGLIRPLNTVVMNHMIGSCIIYDARDQIIKFAEDNNADWVLFVDSDMVLPNDALIKFEAMTLQDKKLDIVSGMCFKRIPPYQPCFYTKARINAETKKPMLETPIDFPEKGLLEVEGMGMACTFIRKEAWRKVKEKTGHWFFPFPGIGEDLSFCIRARMAGIKMYVDLSVDVGHVSQFVVYKNTFYKARDEHIKSKSTASLFT
jgi:GT2 family glycosyltransferase